MFFRRQDFIRIMRPIVVALVFDDCCVGFVNEGIDERGSEVDFSIGLDVNNLDVKSDLLEKPSRSPRVRGEYSRNALPPTATLIDRVSHFGCCARTCSNGAWMSAIEPAKTLRRCNTARIFSRQLISRAAASSIHVMELHGSFVHTINRQEVIIKHLNSLRLYPQ